MANLGTATSGGTSDMLPRERKSASFQVEDLRQMVAGSKAETLRKHLPLFEKYPFNDQEVDIYRSYAELAERKLDRVTESFRIVRSNPGFMAAHMKGKVVMEDMFEHNGIFLHFSMMLSFLKSNASADQKKVWMERAQNGEFIAAYCQTELGHGSNVRGLETTATFDIETQEFEIHSPTLTSMKFWPTGMYACTHALVFANLVIKGKNYGFNGFMVQLRQRDGTCMPGVEVGEIGSKLNGTSINIGYCRFTHVRIPKANLISKNSSVSQEGEYVAAPKKLSKLSYISMMIARTAIIQIAYKELAKAVTIAIRYSAVRKQGFEDSTGVGGNENVILDYQMQQYRTFKALSLAYCLLWNTRFIKDFMDSTQKAIADGDMRAADDLPELHATLSGMKAMGTVWSHEAIEDCRKCCGGQGFLMSSGIAKIAPDFSEWVTVEGEQVILCLQLARFLLKAVDESAAGGQLAASVAYIGDKWTPANLSAPFDAETILSLLAYRARMAVQGLSAKFKKAQSSGLSFDKALNSVAVLAYRAAKCHCSYSMLQNNYLALAKYFTEKPDIKAVLLKLFRLQGLMHISENLGDFAGAVPANTIELVDDQISGLLVAVRPEAVALVDAFGFIDLQLKSTLGRYDGNVYEAIYQEVKRNPLNQSDKMVGWDNYSTVLDLDFLDEGAKTQRIVVGKSDSKL